MTALRRPARLRLALLTLCMLLLAQWTVAAHACPFIGGTGERIAQAQLLQELSDAASAGCPHHAQQRITDGVDHGETHPPSPICLKHCADESSASNGLTASADAPPPRTALRIEPLSGASTRLIGDRPAPAAAAGPPLLIQYCVSLT